MTFLLAICLQRQAGCCLGHLLYVRGMLGTHNRFLQKNICQIFVGSCSYALNGGLKGSIRVWSGFSPSQSHWWSHFEPILKSLQNVTTKCSSEFLKLFPEILLQKWLLQYLKIVFLLQHSAAFMPFTPHSQHLKLNPSLRGLFWNDSTLEEIHNFDKVIWY